MLSAKKWRTEVRSVVTRVWYSAPVLLVSDQTGSDVRIVIATKVLGGLLSVLSIHYIDYGDLIYVCCQHP